MAIHYVDKETGERLRIATGIIDPETGHLADIATGTVELRYSCDWFEDADDHSAGPCGKEIEGPEYLHRFTIPANPTVRTLCNYHKDALFGHIY